MQYVTFSQTIDCHAKSRLIALDLFSHKIHLFIDELSF